MCVSYPHYEFKFNYEFINFTKSDALEKQQAGTESRKNSTRSARIFLVELFPNVHQECQTDTKYAPRICGKFNGNDNILGSRIFDLESRYRKFSFWTIQGP